LGALPSAFAVYFYKRQPSYVGLAAWILLRCDDFNIVISSEDAVAAGDAMAVADVAAAMDAVGRAMDSADTGDMKDRTDATVYTDNVLISGKANKTG
jgi:hypothetical protein